VNECCFEIAETLENIKQAAASINGNTTCNRVTASLSQELAVEEEK